ncbi:MAG: hypothetical protein KDB80_17415 [Planctomycetes bacterium]|nr:hypothetical protein [Planctomycetota bacterium]
MSQPDPRDHALRALLEQRFEGSAPPDLTEQILERAARRDEAAITATEPGEDTMNHDNQPAFEAAAAGASDRGLLGEFLGFMADNSKWWLTPFLIVFGLLGLVVLLGSTGAAPFIYTLF